MKLAKQLFFFYGWGAFQTWWEEGGRERDRTRVARKKRDRKCEGGQNFLMQSSRLQGGLDFPKFLIKAHHLPIFSFALSITTAQSFVILFVCHSAVVNLITCSCEGLLGGREGWSEKKRERERKRETRGGHRFEERREGVKKKKKYHRKLPRLKERKKRLSACSCICLHPLIKGINAWFFSLSHSSEMRSLSVTIVPLPPPSSTLRVH